MAEYVQQARELSTSYDLKKKLRYLTQILFLKQKAKHILCFLPSTLMRPLNYKARILFIADLHRVAGLRYL